MRKSVLWTLAICLMLSGQALAGKMLWEKKLDSDIRFKVVHDTGIIVVGTKDEIYAFDPESGEQKWHLEKMMKNYDPDMVTPQPGSLNMVYVHKEGFTDWQPSVRCINVVTGELVWEWDTGDPLPQLKDQVAALLGKTPKAEEVAVVAPSGWPVPISNVVADAERDQFLLNSPAISVGIGKTIWNPLLKREMVNYKPKNFDDGAIVAVEQKTGKAKWLAFVPKERKAKITYKHSAPLLIGDKIVLTGAGAHIFSAVDGKFLGGSEFKRDGDKGTKSETFDDNTAYIVAKETIVAIDLSSGATKWESEKFKDAIPYMEIVGDKIVAQVGGTFPNKKGEMKGSKNSGILVIDKNSGKFLNDFKKDSKKIKMTTPFHIEDNLVYFGTSKSFRCYDTNALDYKFAVDLGKLDKIDSPKGVVKQGEVICLTMTQSTKAFDLMTGEEKWSQTFKAPGQSRFMKFALVAVSAMAAANAQATANRTGRTQRYTSLMPKLGIRFTAAAASGSYNYTLTNKDGKPTVVGVSLKTGEADRDAQLEDKKADYIIDEIGGFLINTKKKKEIQVFDLKSE
ncbi:MAG: PQQ-binding-like beta-propeller repeat protein [Candidatus Latescibacteria bacterium]|jgi:outer membrane protein assembly factor BamB|nr:PQQ-binding-like beta-propeller repeat protein [Candidatus Latescibacterota bacterium]